MVELLSPHRALYRLAPMGGAVRGTALLLALFVSGCASSGPSPEKHAVPPLVVLVVVDQLRADMLDRWDDLFTGGFRRVRDGGFRFTEAMHDHANTETAPGHATIATGVVPSRHGIVGNDYFAEQGGEWRTVYAVSDSLSRIVDHSWASGRSPANFRRTGVADWLLAADDDSRFVSISRKDRAAIGMAAQARGHVYWILPEAARFVTSAYYRDEYPGWVERFNNNSLPGFFSDSVWQVEVPPAQRNRARADSVWYESDGIHAAFPHRYGEGGPLRFGVWLTDYTPFPDDAVFGLTRQAIDALSLGRDATPDFLAVSLSQTDAVGHKYGPFSLEQLDNMLRLDRLLGEFLDFLDARVGAGRWVLALTADHGVMITPEYLVELGRAGRRIGEAEFDSMAAAVAAAVEAGRDAQLSQRLHDALEAMPWVADMVTESELRGLVPPSDSFVPLFQRSWMQGRGLAPMYRLRMDVRWTEGTIHRDEPGGTTHGSPYRYDRHVPLVFFGAGVGAGVSDRPVRTVDIAPTLADLVGITVPDDLDGVSLGPALGLPGR